MALAKHPVIVMEIDFVQLVEYVKDKLILQNPVSKKKISCLNQMN